MGLFGSKKHKEEKEVANAYVKILGSGCAKCKALEDATREAYKELGREDVTIGHIRELSEIAKMGVMATPGLVVGDKVVSAGRVLTKDEIKDLVVNL